MKQGSERRRSPRYEIQQMVQLSGIKEEFLHATSINISEHGLSCLCDEWVETSDRLFLMLLLSGGRMIKVESIVVWTKNKNRQHELGLEFTDISPADERALKQFLANR